MQILFLVIGRLVAMLFCAIALIGAVLGLDSGKIVESVLSLLSFFLFYSLVVVIRFVTEKIEEEAES